MFTDMLAKKEINTIRWASVPPPRSRSDLRFVKKVTQPDFQAKNFTH